MASDAELDEMRGLLNRTRREFEELANMLRSHVGLDWGATGTNGPHPSVPVPYREIHGPTRESVDATHAMTFVVDFDESVLTLFQAKLQMRIKSVKSNVSAATGASGGGTTKSTTSGGGTTSSSASDHVHAISGHAHDVTIPTHTHTVSATTPSSSIPKGVGGVESITVYAPSANTGVPSVASTQNESASHYHSGTGAGFPNVGSHSHSLNSHTHEIVSASGHYFLATNNHTHDVTLSGQVAQSGGGSTITSASGGGVTSQGGGAHSHTITAHTHDVTLDAHSHTVNLTYGIYEGPAPTSPGITITINGVDRTTALGGPWQTDATIDITEYLREEIGVPLRQANTIVLTANKLIDLEVVCKSLVSAASPLSIGTRTL